MLRLLALIGLIVFSYSSFAQSQTSAKRITVSNTDRKPITVSSTSFANTDTTGVDSVINFIVRLRTSPAAKTSAGRLNQASQIDQEHNEFLSKLNDIRSNARVAGDQTTMSVVHEYKRSINGFTVKANKSLSGAIMKMPHVISITEDKKVKASDDNSNKVINAPKAWNELNASGQGVVIGIIDTGIDYNHPDLGNGIGPQKKVIGGYDFVNNDYDPLDDNGHGTHVAGIASADGVLKGVAPNAKLLAIKVLDAYGSGSDSQVLAGIEYAMDPDGDPTTDDAPDVVNMSLGRAPDANEPMSEAVNNAVLHGICFVIAAGNDYAYLKIGTPGIAEQAITVAAIDNNENTASFSSRGPVAGSFYLKPDVAAPGVDIKSTFPNATYKTLNGTSMATPHVTGVAALMLSKHPDWTPADVKAALMSTADLAEQPKYLETGAGVVDAYQAIATNIIMSPGSISYGKAIASQSVYTREDVLTVSNKGQSQQSITLALKGMDAAAINVTISPSAFTLTPGETKSVKVNITANIANLPKQSIPGGYFGTVELTAGSTKLKTVLSLFNPAITTVKFANNIATDIFFISPGKIDSYQPTSKETEVVLPVGTYDIFAWYPNSLVIIEDFQAALETKSIVIDSKSAKNKIQFKPVDGNGFPFSLDSPNLSTMNSLIGPYTTTLWLGQLTEFSYSDTKKYRMYQRLSYAVPNTGKIYELALNSGTEILSSKVISNNPKDFTPVTLTNPSIEEGQYQNFNFNGVVANLSMPFTNQSLVPNPVTVEVYEDPLDATQGFYTFTSFEGSDANKWETGIHQMTSGGDMLFKNLVGATLKTVSGGPYDFNLGQSLVTFTGNVSATNGRLNLNWAYTNGLYNHSYLEHASGEIKWTLSKGGQKFTSGSFMSRMQSDFQSYNLIDIPIPVDEYKLLLNWNGYKVGTRASKVTTEFKFNTANTESDFYPPVINKFDLVSDGKMTNVIEKGKSASIWIQNTKIYSATTKLQMKRVDAVDWSDMALESSGDIDMKGTIPANLPEGYYSLKVMATDLAGNVVTQILDPAFIVGKDLSVPTIEKVSLLSPLNFEENAGVRPDFTWTSIPNASYTLQVSTTASFSDMIMAETMNKEEYFLSASLREYATYYWRVRATVGEVTSPWSSVYSFRAGTMKVAKLTSPLNDDVVSKNAITFNWTPVASGSSQTFEISTTEDFATKVVYRQFDYTGNYFKVSGLEDKKRYYWRVTTTFDSGSGYTVSSDVNTFTTDYSLATVTGLEDEAGAVQAFPNPFTDRAYVQLFAESDDVARVRLFDHLGRQTRVSDHQLVKGQNTITIESESSKGEEISLIPGLYIAVIELQSGEKFHIKMLCK